MNRKLLMIALAVFASASLAPTVNAVVTSTVRLDDVVTMTYPATQGIYEVNSGEGIYLYCDDWSTPIGSPRVASGADPDTYIESYTTISSACGTNDFYLLYQENDDFGEEKIIGLITFEDWSTNMEPGAIDEEVVGILMDDFIDAIEEEFVANLPAILVFVAGILMLLMGIRMVKRSTRIRKDK